jgi:hypothetical protein
MNELFGTRKVSLGPRSCGGGSGLNLIFVSTLRKMGLDFKDMLVPSKSPFYGIIPGNAAHLLGTVVLPVVTSR